MSDKKDKKDDLLNLIDNIPDKVFNDDKITPDKDNKTDANKRRKAIVQDTDDMNFDEEAVIKARENALEKIENHIQAMKKLVDKDDLANYMLENRIELLEKSKFMLGEYMVTILTQLSSSSRAYEVLAKMLDTVANINDTVVNVKSDREKISEDEIKKIITNTTQLTTDILKENIKQFAEEEKFRTKNKNAITVISNDKGAVK